jgi:hypothetical protein
MVEAEELGNDRKCGIPEAKQRPVRHYLIPDLLRE